LHRSTLLFFFSNTPATTQLYTLSLHDALPISERSGRTRVEHPAVPLAPESHPCGCGTLDDTMPAPGELTFAVPRGAKQPPRHLRSEEHTSELQSRGHLVCRLLLEKKKRR